jgi:hypothetical protein
MPDKHRHLSRQEMLLAADGELPTRRAAEVREHLSACEDCRGRMDAIHATVADFIRLHEEDHLYVTDPQLSIAAPSRARLEARLTEAAGQSRRSLWPHFLSFVFGGRGLAYASAGLLILLGTWAVYQRNIRRGSERAYAILNENELTPVPDPRLTPGAIRAVTLKDICTAQPDADVRTISISEQQQVFQEYRIANARPENYELDYLITPELGGADDIRNLWPEPHSATEWNSYVKDDLENHLHRLVCEGKIDLATAQHDIATNWIFAYKKYFQTDHPIGSQSIRKPDDRWGPAT